jgi:hypothetical protein
VFPRETTARNSLNELPKEVTDSSEASNGEESSVEVSENEENKEEEEL